MYDRTYWKNHVPGIQQGTMQDQDHFNRMELGISDATLTAAIQSFAAIQTDYETASEVKHITLTGNTLPWPFNNSPATVALADLRNNTDYTVEVCVTGYSGGRLGHIRVTDKARNGFKVEHDGSATTVNLTLKIRGGMNA